MKLVPKPFRTTLIKKAECFFSPACLLFSCFLWSVRLSCLLGSAAEIK